MNKSDKRSIFKFLRSIFKRRSISNRDKSEFGKNDTLINNIDEKQDHEASKEKNESKILVTNNSHDQTKADLEISNDSYKPICKINTYSEYHHSLIFDVPKDENALIDDAERDSITAYIGVDIGTKYTKVYFKIVNDTINYQRPVKHEFGDNELFFPTEVFIANSQIFFWEQEKPKNVNYTKYDYLKLKFTEGKKLEILFIIYIVKVITEAKNYVHRFKKSKGDIKYYTLDFEIAVTYPETLFDTKNNVSFEHFKRVITTTDKIINSYSGKSISMSEIEKLNEKIVYNDKEVGIAIYTEAKSEMISFISSIPNTGQVILIDIGEGTTEISGCWVNAEKKINVNVWGSKVMKLGVLHYRKNPGWFKLKLKINLEILLESHKEAFCDIQLIDNFDHANTIFISGGGCTINDITDNLKTLTIHGKKKSPFIVTMDKYEDAKTISDYYHRFLVTMGSIELLEKEYKYEIIDYSDYADNKQKEIVTYKPRKMSRKEKMEEIKRNNGLW